MILDNALATIVLSLLLALGGWMIYALLNEVQWLRKSKIQKDHNQDRKISIFVNNLQRIDAWAELMKGIYKPQIFVIGAVLIIQAVVGTTVILMEWENPYLAWLVGGINFFLCFMALIESIGRNRERNHYERDVPKNFFERFGGQVNKSIENRNKGNDEKDHNGNRKSGEIDKYETESIKDSKSTAERNRYRLKGHNRWFTSILVVPLLLIAMGMSMSVASIIPIKLYKIKTRVILVSQFLLSLLIFGLFDYILANADSVLQLISKLRGDELYWLIIPAILLLSPTFYIRKRRKYDGFLNAMRSMQLLLFVMDNQPLEMNDVNIIERLSRHQYRFNWGGLTKSLLDNIVMSILYICIGVFLIFLSIGLPLVPLIIPFDSNQPIYARIGCLILDVMIIYPAGIKIFEWAGIRRNVLKDTPDIMLNHTNFEQNAFSRSAGKMHLFFPSFYEERASLAIEKDKYFKGFNYLEKAIQTKSNFDTQERIDVERMIKLAEQTGFEAAGPEELKFMLQKRIIKLPIENN